MKAIFQKLIHWLSSRPAGAPSDAPPYEYPNDTDATMQEAVLSIWKCYLQLGKQVQINIQGMGGTLDQYDIHDANLKDGVLSWEDHENPDRLEIHSEAAFRQRFLPWVQKRVKPFSDTGEYAFGVYAIDDQ